MQVISAPSHLGLRPPEPGATPGTARAPEALRDAGLWRRLAIGGSDDLGVVLPGRYLDDPEPQRQRLRNHDAILDHTHRLAERLEQRTEQVLVLGGDCSILLGVGLHLRRRGRYGLVHLDGHTDFRHPAISSECGALAGEDLAAAIGQHWPDVADPDGIGPCFEPRDVIHLGHRDDDEWIEHTRAAGIATISAAQATASPGAASEQVLTVTDRDDLDGYWIHLDVDILDPTYVPAVDSPAPGGLHPGALRELLTRLVPGAAGINVTVFDPDLDPTGAQAALLVDILTEALTGPSS